MMLRVLVDTWGWLTLRDKRESRHLEVGKYYGSMRLRNATIITTDYILDETITLLFRRLPFDLALDSLQTIESAIETGYIQLERITAERFAKALVLRAKYNDKPLISFTDLTSMVIMEELGIGEVLSGDEHFVQVGMGFRLVP